MEVAGQRTQPVRSCAIDTQTYRNIQTDRHRGAQQATWQYRKTEKGTVYGTAGNSDVRLSNITPVLRNDATLSQQRALESWRDSGIVSLNCGLTRPTR